MDILAKGVWQFVSQDPALARDIPMLFDFVII